MRPTSIVLLVIMRKPPQVSRVDYTYDYTHVPALPPPVERRPDSFTYSSGRASGMSDNNTAQPELGVTGAADLEGKLLSPVAEVTSCDLLDGSARFA